MSCYFIFVSKFLFSFNSYSLTKKHKMTNQNKGLSIIKMLIMCEWLPHTNIMFYQELDSIQSKEKKLNKK